MNWIDTHCHLNMPPMQKQIPEVLERARGAQIVSIVVPATDEESSEKTVALAQQYPGLVWAAVGVHPQIDALQIDLARLQNLAQKTGVVAIGEIGLDSEIYTNDLSIQEARFREQLSLAQSLKLPVLVHARGALGKLLGILKEYAPSLAGGIFHSWSGSLEAAEPFFAYNFYCGVSGVITRKHARKKHAMITRMSLSNIVLETDAPGIATESTRKEHVEPRHILEIAEAVAHLKNISLEEVSEVTTSNARKLFKIG